MPTASKLVGALLFAALGFVASVLALPMLEGLTVNPNTPQINAVIGFCMGWFIAGPRAGGGFRDGMSNGVTTTVIGLLTVLGTHGTIFALRASWRGRFRDPTDAMEAMVDYMLQSALRLVHPQEILLLGLGGIGIGLLLEFTHSRAR